MRSRVTQNAVLQAVFAGASASIFRNQGRREVNGSLLAAHAEHDSGTVMMAATSDTTRENKLQFSIALFGLACAS
jgi:hypothetical protein